jgi:vancomycin resistance protein YoaR
VRRSWLGTTGPIALPVRTAPPGVGSESARRALREVAESAVSGPLIITAGDRTVSLQPADFAPSLSVASEGSSLRLVVDGKRLRAAAVKIDDSLEAPAEDAKIVLENGAPTVRPSEPGRKIDTVKLAAAAVTTLSAAGGGDRTVAVELAPSTPKLSTEQAVALGVKERVSTFATNLTSDSKRTENLRIAARTVNGTLVSPGETFSLNGVLGERTPAKGYNQAPAISGGRLVRDYGGGVSQMATTIFNNVFFSGLKDIYHKPHSFYISRYPEGREATVNWPTVDLKWKNDSEYGVLVQAWVDTQVHVSFWSTKVWDITSIKGPRSNPRQPGKVYDDSDGCVAQGANPGFDVSVTRVFSKNGSEVRRETFHTVYIAEDEVICGPDPAKATPTPFPLPSAN